MHKLYSQIQKLKSDARTFFIKYLYEDKDDTENEYLYYLHDENIYWIGDGQTLACGDIFVSLDDIETIVRLDIKRDVFNDHYWHMVENYESDLRINLENYHKFILGGATHEQIMKDLEDEAKRRETPEYKAECEASLKKIQEEGEAMLNQYIGNPTK